MAKSEQLAEVYDTELEAPPFDAEALLNEDLGSLPEAASILGSWLFQVKNGFPAAGVSDKGPWGAVNLILLPIKPAGIDAEEILATTDMGNLPEIRHRAFYTTNTQKREFRDVMAKVGADTSPGRTLGAMLSDARGQYIIATAKAGKDNRGNYETKLSNFRAA